MTNTNLLKLYAPSPRFMTAFLAGDVCGRKLDLWDYLRTWFHHFFSIATNLFSYEGLDDDLQKQIEKRLFFNGVCGIIVKDGDLIAVDANGNGENIYSEPTNFTFSFGNGDNDNKRYSRTINVDGVFAKNTFDFYPSFFDIEKMSFTMAHLDTSIICEAINCRLVDVFVAGNEKSAESARMFQAKVYKGDLSVITDKTQELELERQTRATNNMKELLDAKERTLKGYYEMFGIRKQNEKRERMITDEVEANKELLHFNIKDMLDMREKMCADIRDTFGIECSVVSHVDIDADGDTEEREEMEQEEGVDEDDI